MADAAATIDRIASRPAPPPEPDAVAVAYIHSNEVAYSWYHCMTQLLVADLGGNGRIRRGGYIAMRTNAGQLENARNKAVRHFLEDTEAPWLFWTDTDMGFPPDVIEQLAAVADPEQRPIVGALCFSQRDVAPDDLGGMHTTVTPTIFDWAPIGDLEGFEVRFDYPQNALVRCGATGSACVLIHRSVFERIHAKYGPIWYQRVAAKDGEIGEDLSFCMRAIALDIPVHVHTGVRTTHLKPAWVAETHFLEQSWVPPAAEEVAVLVPVLGRPEHAAPFMASLRASTGLARCYAICDADDEEAIKAWHAEGAYTVIRLPRDGRPGSFAEKVNVGYRHTGNEEGRHGVPPEPWLLLVGSDVRFHPGWVDHALAVAEGDRFHVVGTNDLGNPLALAGVHSPHPLIRRSYIDQVGASWDGPGVVCHEGYAHNYVDQEVVVAAKQRGVWAMALASKVEHLHPLWNKGQPDEVYKLGQEHVEADKELFKRRAAEYLGDVEVTVVPIERTGVATAVDA